MIINFAYYISLLKFRTIIYIESELKYELLIMFEFH